MSIDFLAGTGPLQIIISQTDDRLMSLGVVSSETVWQIKAINNQKGPPSYRRRPLESSTRNHDIKKEV